MIGVTSTNPFGCYDGPCNVDPVQEALPFEFFVAFVFIVTFGSVLAKIYGEYKNITVWSISAFSGFFAVLITCGIAELISYGYMNNYSDDPIPTVIIYAVIAATLGLIGFTSDLLMSEGKEND